MITCPRTGRTWPGEKSIDLRTCVICSGYIDIRYEAWKGESSGAHPQHVTCPPQRMVEAPTHWRDAQLSLEKFLAFHADDPDIYEVEPDARPEAEGQLMLGDLRALHNGQTGWLNKPKEVMPK